MYYISNAKCKMEDGIKGAGVGGTVGEELLARASHIKFEFHLARFCNLDEKISAIFADHYHGQNSSYVDRFESLYLFTTEVNSVPK